MDDDPAVRSFRQAEKYFSDLPEAESDRKVFYAFVVSKILLILHFLQVNDLVQYLLINTSKKIPIKKAGWLKLR